MTISQNISAALEDIKAFCIKNEVSLTTAESVTAGYLQWLFSTTKDAQQFFQGGITVYNNAQKASFLGIDPLFADKYQGVHPEISAGMATKVCPLFHSQIGIGISGFATPVNGTGQFAYLAIVYQDRLVLEQRIETGEEGPMAQIHFANQSVLALKQYLEHI